MALKDTVKRWLGVGVPGGVDDIVVRAVKTGVAVLLATPVVAALVGGKFDVSVDAGVAALLAAGAAAATVLINAVYMALASWSSKP